MQASHQLQSPLPALEPEYILRMFAVSVLGSVRLTAYQLLILRFPKTVVRLEPLFIAALGTLVYSPGRRQLEGLGCQDDTAQSCHILP